MERSSKFKLGMTSPQFILACLIVPSLLGCASHARGPASIGDRSRELLRTSFVIDAELSLLTEKNGSIPAVPGEIKKLTGINGAFWTFDLPSIERVGGWVRRNGGVFQIPSTSTDLGSLQSGSAFQVFLFIEEPPKGFGSGPEDLKKLGVLYAQGLRVFQVAYGDNTALGAGFRDDSAPLTLAGRQVIRELNRLGIAVDVSHVGRRTVLDVAHVSKAPIFAGHANAEALAPHPRNKSDEELRAIAQTGGVIGITPIAAYLKKSDAHQPGISEFVDQIDYVIKLVGIDHVGLGSDGYLNGSTAPGFELAGPELASSSRWEFVVAELLRRGYSGESIQKILGGNYLRALAAVFK